MSRSVPPIHLYTLPILFVVFGGWFYVKTGWGLVAAGIFIVAFVSCIHLIGKDILETYRQILLEKNYTYDKVSRMDESRLFALGLATMPTEVKVTLDKTAVEGNEFSQLFGKLPIEPWKMKIIAQACLKGTPLTIRQWAGKQEEGKILSDPEYRELEATLLGLGFIEYKHPTSPQQGVRWTESGTQFLEQCVASPVS